tara:strand:+ start:287 stop:598 length:312 start_codon:yes stop_codon:yes gene_type:complete
MDREVKSGQLSRYWQEKVAAWNESGGSQKAFCEQHNLNYHQFGYWRRKFGEPRQVTKPAGFAAVQPLPDCAGQGLSLTLPNGILIQGIESHNLPLVRQLLQLL